MIAPILQQLCLMQAVLQWPAPAPRVPGDTVSLHHQRRVTPCIHVSTSPARVPVCSNYSLNVADIPSRVMPQHVHMSLSDEEERSRAGRVHVSRSPPISRYPSVSKTQPQRFFNFFASPTLCLGSDWRLMMEIYQKTALLKSFAKITLLSSD